jgi:Fic family protein
LEYFLKGMAVVFERAAEQVRNEMIEGEVDQEILALLRSLDHRARRVSGLFSTQEFIKSTDVASLLGISVRQARNLLADWVEDGWLEIADPSKRGRKYRLAKGYRVLREFAWSRGQLM